MAVKGLGMDKREMNKRVILDFYENVVNRRDFEAAVKCLGPTYIQHRADAPDGVGGLKDFMDRARERFPQLHCEVKRVFVDGDYVILQVHVVREPGSRGSVHVDIFRLDNGKPVEHWDVDQPIPEHYVHNNGPF
jgi:predicted SnoaL-like aldol condensation-catalyzing enzyme